jgi:hypothetical protein
MCGPRSNSKRPAASSRPPSSGPTLRPRSSRGRLRATPRARRRASGPCSRSSRLAPGDRAPAVERPLLSIPAPCGRQASRSAGGSSVQSVQSHALDPRSSGLRASTTPTVERPGMCGPRPNGKRPAASPHARRRASGPILSILAPGDRASVFERAGPSRSVIRQARTARYPIHAPQKPAIPQFLSNIAV